MLGLDWSILFVVPGIILGLWATNRLKTSYKKYSAVVTERGYAASTVVDDMLRRNGNFDVTLKRVGGTLTDHFDPRDDSLSLSDGVYSSPSIAAVGVAAHEAGHAMQKHDGYALMSLRNVLVPAVSICSTLSTPMFLLGLIFTWDIFVTLGVIFFGASTVFSLLTLPIEFDASNRAVKMLTSGGYITQAEVAGVRSVLNAAAMTYVSNAVTSLGYLVRVVLIAIRRK